MLSGLTSPCATPWEWRWSRAEAQPRAAARTRARGAAAGVGVAAGPADLAHEEQVPREASAFFLHQEGQVVRAVAGHPPDLQVVGAEGQAVPVRQDAVQGARVAGTAQDRRTRQGLRLGVAVGVVLVPMGVQDRGDLEALGPGAGHGGAGIIRRVHQQALAGLAVAQQVAEVAVPAQAELLEDEAHGPLRLQDDAVGGGPGSARAIWAGSSLSRTPYRMVR